jgi:hypothetical protein
MPMGGARKVRIGVAAAFLIAAGVAVLFSAARALDAQGNDRLAQAVTGPDTQQRWVALSNKLVTAKAPLDPATLVRVRAAAIRDPLSAIPYFITGASKVLGGDAVGGGRLVDLSVSRDPRFLPARYTAIRNAMALGKIEEATQATLRVIALDPDSNQTTIPILVELTKDRRSWPAIRKALPTGTNWRETYYTKLVEAGFEPSIVFDVIDVARAASGKPPAVREQNALLSKMVSSADFDRAYTAWLGWLPTDALGKVAYLYDGAFSGAPGAPPFNWTLASGGDGAGVLDKEHGLRFDFAATTNVELATETMLIPAGRYKLITFTSLDETMTQDAPVPVSWQLMCLPKRNIIADVRLPNVTATKGVAATFDVPADCPAQQLTLQGASMEFAFRVGGFVRSVAIEKAK